ncbi:hypothetical protein [Pararhizobium sp.]|uniref:hypothetical protein n=1 Tax=Pararhizobium sp. TaxID=1977563 RepID=UPI002726BC84|nr:hypothetical protein [Pararhizobium sp.]MDO9417047.1 hypothetical protein [Pararhizobium sp.]
MLDLIIGSAPGQLDTLQELADAINDDENFAATVTAALASKASTASVALKLDALQPYASVASAATADIGAAASQSVLITGSTTITSFGTAAAGTIRRLRFAGSLMLTHNITSLILPGYANIQTTGDDCLEAVSLGGGNWIVTKYQFTNAAKAFNVSGLLIPSAVSLGYAAGAGGAVVQATSKATGVTLSKPTGRITTHGASLASASTVVFTVTNTFCADTDTVILNLVSGAAGYDTYIYWARPQNGSFNVILYNRTGGALAEALVFNFTIIKGAIA